jgi:hypothetical protein
VTIVRVERHGPQDPGEYWWCGYDAAGQEVIAFWTEERNPQNLIDTAEAELVADTADCYWTDSE